MIRYFYFFIFSFIFIIVSCTDRTPIFNILSDYENSDEYNLSNGAGYNSVYTNALYADKVISAKGVIDAYKAVNGVYGAGNYSGSLDVCQLNFQTNNGNYIILRWANKIVLNGTGADIVVFENGFEKSAEPGHYFMDLVVISLSYDGTNWATFPFDYTYSPETVYTDIPNYWSGFGGKTPVLYNEDNNRVNPFNKTEAGGDQFDLSDLPDTETGIFIKKNGFKYIKIITAPSLINSDTGTNFVKSSASNGADIDGVYARYFKIEE